MDNVKNDEYFIGRIHDDLTFILRYMQGTDVKTFYNNELLQDSMMFRLIQISENARKLSDQYREQHPDIPWTAMSGLCNRIVHDYSNVIPDIVFDTLKNDIPELIKIMKEKLEK